MNPINFLSWFANTYPQPLLLGLGFSTYMVVTSRKEEMVRRELWRAVSVLLLTVVFIGLTS